MTFKLMIAMVTLSLVLVAGGVKFAVAKDAARKGAALCTLHGKQIDVSKLSQQELVQLSTLILKAGQ